MIGVRDILLLTFAFICIQSVVLADNDSLTVNRENYWSVGLHSYNNNDIGFLAGVKVDRTVRKHSFSTVVGFHLNSDSLSTEPYTYFRKWYPQNEWQRVNLQVCYAYEIFRKKSFRISLNNQLGYSILTTKINPEIPLERVYNEYINYKILQIATGLKPSYYFGNDRYKVEVYISLVTNVYSYKLDPPFITPFRTIEKIRDYSLTYYFGLSLSRNFN